MTRDATDPLIGNLIGFWDFLSGSENRDTGLADGFAQDGSFARGAFAAGGQLRTDGRNDRFDVRGEDSPFDLSSGTISTQFTQDRHRGNDPDTIVSRGESRDILTEGYFGIQVTRDGAVEVLHAPVGTAEFLRTDRGFFSEGDEVNVVYSWNAASGASLTVTNVSSGAAQTVLSETLGLTLDIGDNDDESFTFGAREYDDGRYDRFFDGSIDFVAVYDQDIISTPEPPDGIVEGTENADVIDTDYLGDPGGDLVDAGDALLPGEAGDDDIILAGGGDDLIEAGAGADEVSGGAGNDTIFGGAENDLIEGGDGNDLIDGGAGADGLSGGTGQDTFVNLNAGDVVDGGTEFDDFDTLDLRGSAAPGGSLSVEFTGPDSNGNGQDGLVRYYDDQGQDAGVLVFSEIESVVPCFTPGTLIATPNGARPVESLRVGDLVNTRDNGLQPIRWSGAKRVSKSILAASPHLVPVIIRRGALGAGRPERDMRVSPNHRVLIVSDRAELYFENREVLIAAKHLVGWPGIERASPDAVTYVHLLFDQHEVILSDGAWTESFQPGEMSLAGVGSAQRSEILELFPELETRSGLNGYQAARRALKAHEAVLLSL